jgi:tetratricopeptide (TPR) repeat protein
MQGSGLLSLMLGKTVASPTGGAYCETYYPSEFGWSPLRAVRSGRYKYIDAPKPELYDLVADPQETHNLYQSKRAVALELKSQFDSLVARITPKGTPRRALATPADVEMLASLGYLGTSGAPAVGRPGQPLPDPKDELPTYELLFASTQLAAEGQCARALPLLTRLTQEQPTLFLGQLTLGKCELTLGNYAAAEATLNSALRLRSDNLEFTARREFDAKFYYGICLYQEGRLKDALASLQPLAKMLPDAPYLHFYLGSIHEKDGESGQALEEYQKCAAIDPSFEVAVYKVGFLLAKSGKFGEAAVQFKKVAEMDPSNAAAHFNLALAYQESGNEAAARPEFETACKLDQAKCLPRDQQ